MIWGTRTIDRPAPVDLEEWHPVFALVPHQLLDGRWVWWEILDRRLPPWWEHDTWQYRLPPRPDCA